MFGLDISEGAIRAVKLAKKGKKMYLESFNQLPIAEGIISDGQIIDSAKFVSAINTLLKKAHGKPIKDRMVVSVLPESSTFIKVISVPVVAEKDLPEAINEEIKKHVPLEIDEIYLDWQLLGKTESSTRILVGAAPKQIVDNYVAALGACGLTISVLEIEAAAIARALITKNNDGATILIDIGAMRTGLTLYDHDSIQLTVSLPLSGNKITKTIAQKLNLDLEKAEQAKIICGLDPQKCEGALLKILVENINSLIVQIKKTAAFYQANFENPHPVSEIILCGGGANFSNIDQVLNQKLNVAIKIGKPLENIMMRSRAKITTEQALSYTTVIGLAMRAAQNKIWNDHS